MITTTCKRHKYEHDTNFPCPECDTRKSWAWTAVVVIGLSAAIVIGLARAFL
jgi:hypothetical protein